LIGFPDLAENCGNKVLIEYMLFTAVLNLESYRKKNREKYFFQ